MVCEFHKEHSLRLEQMIFGRKKEEHKFYQVCKLVLLFLLALGFLKLGVLGVQLEGPKESATRLVML